MRIISGINGGRRLKAPEGLSTRPTLEKIRGAIFNSLYDVEDMSFLDMFGGSGAMGLEAVSRGAGSCVIVEKDRKAYDIIRDNVAHMDRGTQSLVKVRNCDYRKAFPEGESFDIIFLDPPYFEHILEDALLFIKEKHLAKTDGIIICETDSKIDINPEESGYSVWREKTYGSTKVLFLKQSGG